MAIIFTNVTYSSKKEHKPVNDVVILFPDLREVLDSITSNEEIVKYTKLARKKTTVNMSMVFLRPPKIVNIFIM